MKKMLLCIIFFILITAGYSQGNTNFDFNRKYSTSEMKKDLAILKDSLETFHPALYRYTTKADFDLAFKKADNLINKPLTQTQFYVIAASLTSKIGDIHTTIEPSDEALSFITTKSKLLPFDVRIIDKKVFIASNNSTDSSIRVGSRILKINNKPIEEVLGKMESCFSDEGTNETLKLKRAEQRFTFQYYLVYGYSDFFKLEYSFKRNPSQVRTIAAQPYSVIKTKRIENQQKYPDLKSLFPQPPYLSFSIDAKRNLAILTIKWFQNDVLQEANQQFKPFIDSAFREIRSKKIGNLIIDIRNNGGGESENASYLYSYLADKPFRFLYSMETRHKTYTDDVARGVKYTVIPGSGNYQTTDSTTNYQQFFGLNYQQPMINNFSGKLYVLVDGLTTSAAPQFASLVKLNHRGILIGENVPGSLLGGSGRGYSYFYLPNTGLLTMISKYRLYLTDPIKISKDCNIIPDFKPVRSFGNTIKGVDKDLEYAVQLISEPR